MQSVMTVNALQALHGHNVWIHSSLLGDGSECRDFVIHCGIIQPLLSCITPSVTVRLIIMGGVSSVTSFCLLSSSLFRLIIFAILLGLYLIYVVTRIHLHQWTLYNRYTHFHYFVLCNHAHTLLILVITSINTVN